MVQLRFASRELERRKLGAAVAKSLRLRVTELVYAARMRDLLEGLGRWEEMRGDRRGQWSARLSANWRLIVEPDPDMTSATVRVVEVVDYHER